MILQSRLLKQQVYVIIIIKREIVIVSEMIYLLHIHVLYILFMSVNDNHLNNYRLVLCNLYFH